MDEKYWVTLFTNPHKEYTVVGQLQSKGFAVYLPEERNKIQRRDRPSSRPFFPGYLFLRIEPDRFEYDEIRWLPGIRQIVSFGGGPALVPDTVIQYLRARLEHHNEQRSKPLEVGEKVRFASGLLKGFDGIFDGYLSANDRVRVLLDAVSRTQVSIEVDLSDLLVPKQT